MINDEIKKALFENQDLKYRDFHSALVPSVEKEKLIGVRVPIMRKLAKEFSKREDIGEFLSALPHEYFDENQIHSFIISDIKDYTVCIEEVKRFLPFVDNWAVCDGLSPKVFKKHKPELLKEIEIWINSDEPYTVRFAVKMLMDNFLDSDFDLKYPKMVAKIRSDEYYVNMMLAWYFATALAKQYDSVLPFIEEKKLDKWTHNKAIQKARESFRVTPEHKEYLKALKIT